MQSVLYEQFKKKKQLQTVRGGRVCVCTRMCSCGHPRPRGNDHPAVSAHKPRVHGGCLLREWAACGSQPLQSGGSPVAETKTSEAFASIYSALACFHEDVWRLCASQVAFRMAAHLAWASGVCVKGESPWFCDVDSMCSYVRVTGGSASASEHACGISAQARRAGGTSPPPCS